MMKQVIVWKPEQIYSTIEPGDSGQQEMYW